jgi:hypothetical protein
MAIWLIGSQSNSLPPGITKGAKLYHWQFGVTDTSFPADIGTARRLAEGKLKPFEAAVLDVVLSHESDVPQRELERLLAERMGASRSQVYVAAQRLAKHRSLCRKKVGRQWHYAKPGYSWRSAAKQRHGA